MRTDECEMTTTAEREVTTDEREVTTDEREMTTDERGRGIFRGRNYAAVAEYSADQIPRKKNSADTVLRPPR